MKIVRGDVEYRVEWCWTNWTFGVWWAALGRRQVWSGIDVGPLEIVRISKRKEK